MGDLGVLEVPQRPPRLGMQVTADLGNTMEVHPSRTLSRNRAKWVRPHVNNEEGKKCLAEGYTEPEKLSITHMHTCTLHECMT